MFICTECGEVFENTQMKKYKEDSKEIKDMKKASKIPTEEKLNKLRVSCKACVEKAEK